MKKFMYALFYHLRREVCMWLVGLVECPRGIKKNYWTIAEEVAARVFVCIVTIIAFGLIFVYCGTA